MLIDDATPSSSSGITQSTTNYDINPYLKELMMFATPDQSGDSRSLDSTDAMDSGNNCRILWAYNDHGASTCPFIFGNDDKSKFVATRNQNYIRFLNIRKRQGRRPARRGDGNSGSTSNTASRSGPSTQQSNNGTRTGPSPTKKDDADGKSGK